MTLLFISFLAGLLTVLAPCVLPLLPVIVGGSISGEPNPRRALVTIASLAASVFVFTFILKVSTAFISVPPQFWSIISGVLLIVFGLITFFPKLWDSLPFINALNQKSSVAMNAGFKKKSFWGDIIIGAALGPVFSSCSPTYFLILATVLPASLTKGILYLAVYIVGLSIALFAIALLGQRLVGKLDNASNPNGWFKRGLGLVFLIVGVLIIFGLDKKIEAGILSHAGILDVTRVEQYLLTKDDVSQNVSGSIPENLTIAEKDARYPKAPELVSPDAYLNTGGQPISIAQYRGKDIVLVDFWTYSCINCQRTLPYLTTWYGKYKDQGLVIIGVHTPEFAFEHVQSNVQKALTQFGITYPVVLDNEYKTWDAFGNNVWPRKYLIDIDGYIVYDHSGEGDYDVIERAIQSALRERATRLGLSTNIATSTTDVSAASPDGVGSPETYFGWSRNEYLASGKPHQAGSQTMAATTNTTINHLYLSGTWNFANEYATSAQGTTITYRYDAKNVYLVASADVPVSVSVMQDGKPLGSVAGKNVAADGTVTISASQLYSLVSNASAGEHVLQITVHGAARFYTFTFG